MPPSVAAEAEAEVWYGFVIAAAVEVEVEIEIEVWIEVLAEVSVQFLSYHQLLVKKLLWRYVR